MVVERSHRRCLLCDRTFAGRAFVCRTCADRFRAVPIPPDVLRQFYRRVDTEYPEWANTYGNYNPPRGILNVLKTLPHDSRVLEIGAGGGFLLAELAERGFTNLTGSDVTPTSLAEISRRHAAIRVAGGDGEALPFRNQSFDIVISSDVIEHLPHINSHLSEVRRVLTPSGKYLFKTPNRTMAELYYRLRGLYDYHIWHPSMLSAVEADSLLRGYGFDVRLLPVDELTAAQLRKIPTQAGKTLARWLPMRRVPTRIRPHLEIEASLRT